MDKLAAYFQFAMEQPWAWGRVDCTMFVADWVQGETGLDPASRCRGKYATAIGAQRLIKREGGYLPMIGYDMDRLEFRRTLTPQRGDVGIIRAPTQMVDRLPVVGAISAIFDGRFWVARALNGLRAGQFELLQSWRIQP